MPPCSTTMLPEGALQPEGHRCLPCSKWQINAPCWCQLLLLLLLLSPAEGPAGGRTPAWGPAPALSAHTAVEQAAVEQPGHASPGPAPAAPGVTAHQHITQQQLKHPGCTTHSCSSTAKGVVSSFVCGIALPFLLKTFFVGLKPGRLQDVDGCQGETATPRFRTT
jgi:hypothetical protein